MSAVSVNMTVVLKDGTHRELAIAPGQTVMQAAVDAGLPGIIGEAMLAANCTFEQLDGIAVTYGPGLSSSLLVGYSAARALSQRLGIPLTGVHHHEGHIYSVFLSENPPVLDKAFPMMVLLVSGGDTKLVYMKAPGHYEIVGQTIDDAAGEALDKGAMLLGLGYPG